MWQSCLLLVCLSAFSIVQSEAPESILKAQQEIEKAILEVQDQMQKAAQQGNAEALYSYVMEMDRGVIIENGRLRRTKQEALELTKQGMQSFKDVSYSYSQKHITVISPNAVLWVAEGTSSATLADGSRISAPFAETIVFMLNDGRWRVLHAHRSTPNR